jgi:hypothetical protein
MEHVKNLLVLFSIVYMAAFLSGCSTFGLGSLTSEGAKASALCLKGGPGGTLGIGPGGIAALAKVNQDFKGTVGIATDCSMAIQSE